MVAVVTAHGPDAEWIADLIGGAFQHLPVTEWLVPDPAARARVLPRNFQIVVEHALEHGEIHTTSDRSAAAVWLPRGATEVPPPRDYERRVLDVCGEYAQRFFELDALFDKHHPGALPHHYLALLAVRGDRQGEGLGTALLRHHHATLDQASIPAYLEASSTGSRDLYARLGYDLMAEAYGAANGALFWPMWRDPA